MILRRIKYWFKELWIKLTFIPVIMFDPKDKALMEDNKWYEVTYFVKKSGNHVRFDEIRMIDAKESTK